MKPSVIFLAGPNGSGKSTLSRTAAFVEILETLDARLLNPDDLALQSPKNQNPLIWSGRKLRQQISEFITDKISFAVETTLSGQNHFRTLEQCRLVGYRVALHYVYVSQLELAKARVSLRVRLGGHDVPELDQTRRYEKSLNNCCRMIGLCDEVHIYNNDSSINRKISKYGLIKIAEFERGTLKSEKFYSAVRDAAGLTFPDFLASAKKA